MKFGTNSFFLQSNTIVFVMNFSENISTMCQKHHTHHLINNTKELSPNSTNKHSDNHLQCGISRQIVRRVTTDVPHQVCVVVEVMINLFFFFTIKKKVYDYTPTNYSQYYPKNFHVNIVTQITTPLPLLNKEGRIPLLLNVGGVLRLGSERGGNYFPK